MKTPREILLGRHRAAEPKLDAVRKAALAALAKVPAETSPPSWRDWLRSLRWHAVGLGAAWLFILFLRLNSNPAPEMMAVVPPAKVPPPQVIMASLREYRHQLLEMMETNSPAVRPLELFPVFPARPRSERREEMSVV